MQPIVASQGEPSRLAQEGGLSVTVREGRQGDVSEIVQLHMTCQPLFLWADPGSAFLRLFYALLLREPQGTLLVSECNGGLAGFVAGVSDLARIQEKLDPGRLAFLAATTNCLLTHPMRLRSLFQDFHRANHFRRDFVDASKAGQELITVAVQPRCRGQGHGKALLHALIERARRDRVVQLRASIDSSDQGMSYFFRKFGFIPIRTFRVFGGRWRDEYLLRISERSN